MSKYLFRVACAVGFAGCAAWTQAAVEIPDPNISTYVNSEGATYFAVSLSPNVPLPQAAAAHQVVILFDTSASQTSLYRDKALEALNALLVSLSGDDRVQLLAVDLDAVPLTETFVAPRGAEMDHAIAALKDRVPLGATDMPAAVRAGQSRFDKSDKARAVIYIGDGMSTAHFVALGEFRKLVDSLAAAKIPVSGFAIGPRVDSLFLASLANQTGGVLAVDGEELSAKEVGLFLAKAAEATVLWPVSAKWPAEFADVFPTRVPPLRSDRDTIVLGTSKDKLAGELQIALTVESGGKQLPLRWTLALDDSNPDLSFLPSLVERSRTDSGLRLITLGTPGLKETRRLYLENTEQLAKLAAQAITSGNLDGAERLADEALRYDPLDETARGVKQQVARKRADASGKPAAKAEEKVEIRRFSNEQAAPPRTRPAQFRVPPGTEPVAPVVPPVPVPVPPGTSPIETPPVPVPVPPVDLDVNDAEGRLLSAVEQNNRLITDLVRAEVENELRQARGIMSTDPLSVEQSLKLMLERVMKVPELRAEVRAQLRGQLEMALREAYRRAATKDILDQQAQEARSAALERLRVAEGLVRDQERLRQLVDRFNALMDEGRYAAADEIGSVEIPRIDPTLPIATSTSIIAHLVGARQADLALRQARAKAVVATLGAVETSMMPFPDDQPVVYPDAAAWEELTARRKKYTHTDLRVVGPAERKIQEQLEEPTSIDFVETSLSDVVDYLKDYHSIEIQLDRKALEDQGLGSDTQVTRKLAGISLRSALRLMLDEFGLTYIIKDEVLKITTKEVADAELITKAYPVADLVIPIISRSAMGGGMGGGMMGGMGGGMGGGMMGGMGGMGGGMGGMGGGMFSVPEPLLVAAVDDLKLGPKKSSPTPAPSAQRSTKRPATITPPASQPKSVAPKSQAAGKAAPAASAPVAGAAKPAVKKAEPITLPTPADGNWAIAWNDYFASHDEVKPEAVRETVRKLANDRQMTQVIAMIQAALRHGAAQPWMYEALGIAMQASGASKSDIERVLMSGVDFGEATEDLMYVAQYMARSGLESRALKVFEQVAALEPLRPEPYLYGLQLAQRLNDVDGIRWSSLGILKQAWPKDKQDLVRSASGAAKAVLAQLKAANRTTEAQEFAAELEQAKIRDCIVKVTWTGDADIDLMVEEPSGSTASFRNPRTSGGGIIVGDTASQDKRGQTQGLSETYVCPEAFDGTYRVLVRRVWGKVTAGKVTVDLYSHAGTPEEKHMREQIPIGDDDALVVFDMKEGRRKEPISDHLLANAAAGQLAVNQAVLLQQINSMSQQQGATANLGVSRQGLIGVPFVQQAVGYMPVIVPLPSGASFSVNGVVSADRRYVRISPTPFFTGVGSVTTFNIQSGTTGTSPGPGAGGTQPGQTPPGASQTNPTTGS